MTLRAFTYKNYVGREEHVQAERVEFTPGAVLFWKKHPYRAGKEFLVLAETYQNVRQLKEVDDG